jgi:hypothetical protein
MGDRAIIAREGETVGVYVHWAGELRDELVKIIERDGVERTLEVLMTHHWSNIRHDAHGRPLGHTEFIEGYGNAYTDLPRDADPVCMPVGSESRTCIINKDGTVHGG